MIQFSKITQFNSLWHIDKTLLPHQARVDMGVIAMKGCSAFSKVATLLELHFISRTLFGELSYSSEEVQSVYFTAPADWAILIRIELIIDFIKYYFA